MCLLKQSIPPYTNTPFKFVETGISVFSFEELLFHCYHYWKESLNDLENGKVAGWVKNALGLGFLGSQIDKIMETDAPISEKYMKFIALEDYFDADDLDAIENSIVTWENKTELEKLKQQGDERLAKKDYEKAVYYYERLLAYGESAAIYNNIGCCRMKLGQLNEAENNFMKAMETDRRNAGIKLNLATLYLLQSREGAAEKLLLELERTDNDRNVQYYLGDLEFKRNNLEEAEEYFRCSVKMGNTLDGNAALCRIALKSKDYEKARAFVDKMPEKSSSQYLENMAKINYASGNTPSAIENVEQLLAASFDNAAYWAFAAKLYRENGSFEKASNAIEKAYEIDKNNENVIFENAKIKKSMGKTLEYQTLISKVVELWKTKYRLSS